MEIGQDSWQSGEATIIESSKTDRWWGLKVHKVNGGLDVRWQLKKIVNLMVIVKVCW